jgi:hypothetical protein
MTKYYVLTEGQLEQIAETVKAAILKAVKPLNLPMEPDQARAEKQAGTKGRRGQKKLSVLIYENMGDGPFTPQEAYQAVSGKYTFRGDRGLDSVRYSLKSDTARFQQIDDGRYIKTKG